MLEEFLDKLEHIDEKLAEIIDRCSDNPEDNRETLENLAAFHESLADVNDDILELQSKRDEISNDVNYVIGEMHTARDLQQKISLLKDNRRFKKSIADLNLEVGLSSGRLENLETKL